MIHCKVGEVYFIQDEIAFLVSAGFLGYVNEEEAEEEELASLHTLEEEKYCKRF